MPVQSCPQRLGTQRARQYVRDTGCLLLFGQRAAGPGVQFAVHGPNIVYHVARRFSSSRPSSCRIRIPAVEIVAVAERFHDPVAQGLQLHQAGFQFLAHFFDTSQAFWRSARLVEVFRIFVQFVGAYRFSVRL